MILPPAVTNAFPFDPQTFPKLTETAECYSSTPVVLLPRKAAYPAVIVRLTEVRASFQVEEVRIQT